MDIKISTNGTLLLELDGVERVVQTLVPVHPKMDISPDSFKLPLDVPSGRTARWIIVVSLYREREDGSVETLNDVEYGWSGLFGT